MKHRSMTGYVGLMALLSIAPSLITHAQKSGDTGTSNTAAAQQPDPVLSDPHARYRLRAGDTFEVDFTLTPEFNQTVAVQPDGFASFKAVGSASVQGKTIPEVTEEIRTLYQPVLHEPLVVVVLKEFEKPYFIATGQVSHPGKYELRSDLGLAEALALAGGPTDKAKLSKVVLYRRVEGGFAGREIDLKKLLSAHNLSEDPRLQPGDLVYVPQNVYSHIQPFLPTTSMGAYYNPLHY